MMRNLALLIAAWMHEPTRHDVHRFGLPLEPALQGDYVSPVRFDWRWTCRQLEHRRKHGDLAAWNEAAYRERCFYWLDDLADSSRPDGVRDNAAVQLKDLLGPLAYYRGVIPSPWIED